MVGFITILMSSLPPISLLSLNLFLIIFYSIFSISGLEFFYTSLPLSSSYFPVMMFQFYNWKNRPDVNFLLLLLFQQIRTIATEIFFL